jgi:hypothetical protein
VKTSKAALAAGLFAGLAALPLTTVSAANAPSGNASASALTVKLSLAPLKTLAGASNWAQVESALSQVQQALCGSQVGCNPLGLTLPTSLPDSLTVRVAQAEDAATFNEKALDVVAGHSDSTPVASDWTVLNANLKALGDLITNLVQGGLNDVANQDLSALQGLLSPTNGNLTANIPVLGTASFDLLGTVAASLPGKAVDQATAVQVTGSGPVDGLDVTVDPFHATAVDTAGAVANKVDGAQVSADNSLTKVSLPALSITGSNAADLKGLATELKTLIDAITNVLANPTQAGSILGAAASALPAPLQGPLGTIGGTLSGVTGTVTSGVSSAAGVDLTGLKALDTSLSAALDSLNALINALAAVQLPDVSSLITSTADIATAKTVPVAGGGVASTATATLGAVDVLPIGSTL